jgi:hypothetical protein
MRSGVAVMDGVAGQRAPFPPNRRALTRDDHTHGRRAVGARFHGRWHLAEQRADDAVGEQPSPVGEHQTLAVGLQQAVVDGDGRALALGIVQQP